MVGFLVMATDVSLLAAFVAGVFSISSPCVLPLIPIYLAHIAGVSVGDQGQDARARVMRNAAAYVAGFSVVFVALGAALGAAGALAGTLDLIPENRTLIVRVGGALLIALGLYQSGLVRIPWLDRDRRVTLTGGSRGTVASSFLIGVTFGAGWSPCLGPILGAILTLAAGQGSVARATGLLSVYSLGLAVPFLAAAAVFGSAPSIIRAMNGRLHLVTSVSGAVMLGVGLVMVLGLYERLFTEIIRAAPWTPWEPSL
jgi:cytochrome c-type biogenesis protein